MTTLKDYKLYPSPAAMATRGTRPSLFDSDVPFDFEQWVTDSAADDPEAFSNPFPLSSADIGFPIDPAIHPPPNPDLQHAYSDVPQPHLHLLQAKKQDKSKDPAPPWAELKTKAGKDRKRLPLACIACRRKKIRCSGEKPACKHCMKVRIPCVYKVTTRRATPRTDYMVMLDRRLKRMEDRVIKAIPKDEEKPDIPRAIVKPDAARQAQKAATGGPSRKRTAEEAFSSRLDNWANPENASAATFHPQILTRSEENEVAELLSLGRDQLPSREIQDHLIEVYFDYIYGQSYAVIHKPSFSRAHNANKIPPVLLLAICAASARFSTHTMLQRADEPPFLRGEVWANEAQKIALQKYDSPSIYLCWTLLLLALHTFGTCQGGKSWMLAGMAHRMAYALQLHKDLEIDPTVQKTERKAKLSFTDRETRRRTMWACFIMDRLNSSGTERPMFAGEENMHIRLPVKEDMFQLELAGNAEYLQGQTDDRHVSGSATDTAEGARDMGVAAYLVRIIAIWGRWNQYLNLGGRQRDEHACDIWHPESGWHDLWRQLQDFRASLPPELHYSDENIERHAVDHVSNQFLLMHVVIYQTMLFANRFAYPAIATVLPPKEAPKQFCDDAAVNALEAAQQLSRVCDAGIEHRLVAPFAGYAAFMSGSVHIHGIFSQDPELAEKSKRYLTINIKFLTKLKKYWGMLGFVLENLKDLYAAHADASNKGTSLSASRLQARRALQFGDWYGRYPHGVSKTDYIEPATAGSAESAPPLSGGKSDLQSVEEFMSTMSQSPTAEQHQGATSAKRKANSAAAASRKRQSLQKREHSGESQAGAQQQLSPSFPQLSPSSHRAQQEAQKHTQQPRQRATRSSQGPMSAPIHQSSAGESSNDSIANQYMFTEPYNVSGMPAYDRRTMEYFQQQAPRVSGFSPGMDAGNLMGGVMSDDGNGGWAATFGGMSDDWLRATGPSSIWFTPFNVSPNYLSTGMHMQGAGIEGGMASSYQPSHAGMGHDSSGGGGQGDEQGDGGGGGGSGM